MTYHKPTRTTRRRFPTILVVGLLVVMAAIAATFDYPILVSSTAATPTIVLHDQELPMQQLVDDHVLPTQQPVDDHELPVPPLTDDHAGPLAEQETRQPADDQETHLDLPDLGHQRDHEQQDQAPDRQPERGDEKRRRDVAPPLQDPHEPEQGSDGVSPGMLGEHQGVPGEPGGTVPDGTTIFDDELPDIANLDPALLGALRRAATDAADDGVAFFVTSGWRSPEYQEQLLREAVATYGSEEEAARWVASPTTSAHVSGDAVDIGPFDARVWLSEHGAKYGLCQIYRNEPWHYELRPDAIDHGCPPVYADPTHDPRMQQ